MAKESKRLIHGDSAVFKSFRCSPESLIGADVLSLFGEIENLDCPLIKAFCSAVMASCSAATSSSCPATEVEMEEEEEERAGVVGSGSKSKIIKNPRKTTKLEQIRKVSALAVMLFQKSERSNGIQALVSQNEKLCII